METRATTEVWGLTVGASKPLLIVVAADIEYMHADLPLLTASLEKPRCCGETSRHLEKGYACGNGNLELASY